MSKSVIIVVVLNVLLNSFVFVTNGSDGKKSRINQSSSSKLGPRLVGPKLIGVFEDDFDHEQSNHQPLQFVDKNKRSDTVYRYSKQAQQKNHSTNNKQEDPLEQQVQHRHPHNSHVNMKMLHFCNEIIFENGTLHRVPTRKPRCALSKGSSSTIKNYKQDSSTKISNRFKRDINSPEPVMPELFFIPDASDNEIIAVESYIRMQIKVCSQPGGEVLLFDIASGRILSKFKNGGISYQCNKYSGDFELSISDSNKVSSNIVLNA